MLHTELSSVVIFSLQSPMKRICATRAQEVCIDYLIDLVRILLSQFCSYISQLFLHVISW